MKNKKILLISIISILIVVIGIVIMLFISNKKNNNDNIITSEIDKIVILENNDSAKAAELIKKNTVKIINEIDEETKIMGTGFFHESGYLVTNSHIVDIKGKVKIEYADGTNADAKLISNDITSDIAILQVEKPNALAMSFGNTLKLNVTDEVYSVGYAYALEGESSVSKGVLSARRTAGGIEYLQTDLALNAGNSGGPLINAKGEFLGINTYATENASISMSISAESLDIIIDKLIKNKKVNYLEKEREPNALSVVLKEIGYDTNDIYNENKIIEKKFSKNEESTDKKEDINSSNDNQQNSESHSKNNKVDNNKSNNSRLSTLNVEGSSINFNPDVISYCILLRNKNVNSLNITAIAQEKESKITIKNNKIEQGKCNKVSIDVIAPNNINGHVYDIWTLSSKDVLAPDRLKKIIIHSYLEYIASKGENFYKIYWNYADSDGVTINGDINNITSIVSSYKINLYVTNLVTKRDENGVEGTVEEKRFLKSYSFNGSGVDHEFYTGPCGNMRETAYISINEIRQLLSDNDYYNDSNQAAITFKVTVNTYHQGTITGDTWLWLNK